MKIDSQTFRNKQKRIKVNKANKWSTLKNYLKIGKNLIEILFRNNSFPANFCMFIKLIDKPINEIDIFGVDWFGEDTNPFFIAQRTILVTIYYPKERFSQILFNKCSI